MCRAVQLRLGRPAPNFSRIPNRNPFSLRAIFGPRGRWSVSRAFSPGRTPSSGFEESCHRSSRIRNRSPPQLLVNTVENPALRHPRKRRWIEFHFPKRPGVSRQRAPLRARHKMASRNVRLFLAVPPPSSFRRADATPGPPGDLRESHVAPCSFEPWFWWVESELRGPVNPRPQENCRPSRLNRMPTGSNGRYRIDHASNNIVTRFMGGGSWLVVRCGEPTAGG